MKKQRFHVSKRGDKWTGQPEAKGGGSVSTNKEEVLEHVLDKARVQRPSEVIIHEGKGEIKREQFEDKPDPDKPMDFISD